jgi:hypothetical protein
MGDRRLWSEAEHVERRELLDKLERAKGTTEDAERWVARLKEIDPLFEASDYMISLERGVRARRILDRLVADIGDEPSRDQLVDLVARVQGGGGTEEEIHAWLMFVERHVPDPSVSDLIYHSDPELSAEEVIERASAYRPIILGPAAEPD